MIIWKMSDDDFYGLSSNRAMMRIYSSLMMMIYSELYRVPSPFYFFSFSGIVRCKSRRTEDEVGVRGLRIKTEDWSNGFTYQCILYFKGLNMCKVIFLFLFMFNKKLYKKMKYKLLIYGVYHLQKVCDMLLFSHLDSMNYYLMLASRVSLVTSNPKCLT